MTITRYSRLIGILASPLLVHCVGPQAPAEDASSTQSASQSVASADVPAVAAVIPTGALISDGTSNMALNLDPPGSWFTFNDKTANGTMEPASTGDFASALKNGMIHTKGSGFLEWGGGIGMNLVGSQMLQPADASKYKGIKFKASGSTALHFGLATQATMPEFGQCKQCYDHFAVDITDLTDKPKEYEFTWAKLRQAGWGSPKAPLDPRTIVGLNFTSKGPTAWDFAIDDIAFIE